MVRLLFSGALFNLTYDRAIAVERVPSKLFERLVDETQQGLKGFE
jgi:hypothetical protein